MDAKKYLGSMYRIDIKIKAKLEQLEYLKSMVFRVTSIISDEKTTQTRNNDALSNTIAKMIDLEADINKKIDQLIDTRRDIAHTIELVESDEEKTLLELRYMCFNTWEEIADKMKMSKARVFQINGKALQTVRELIGG
jgi:DNA-directed RNA polymerase specialized sigma subunit